MQLCDRTEICTNNLLLSGKDSCGGDSGGPLMGSGEDVQNEPHYLIGIVSFGTGVCGIVSVIMERKINPEAVLISLNTLFRVYLVFTLKSNTTWIGSEKT